MYSYDVSNYPANRPAFSWVTDNTRKFMAKGYLDSGVTPEQRALQIVESYHKRMLSMGYPSSLADYNATILRKGLEQGHVSFSTPAWVSYGLSKGLAISCFGSDIGHESMEDILFAASEIGMLTKYGGGTSINLNKLRSRGTPISVGGKADGAAHFAALFNSIMKIARQGEARRGYCAAYLNAGHGDIEEFLGIGRDNSELQNITTGIIFPENYLAEAAKGDESKQDVILKAAKVRSEIGYPYIGFQKNMNAYRPQCYVDRDMEVDMSNLCSEILLPNGLDESFVCVLSSLNLVHYDEWKSTPLVRVMISFLDTLVEESIEKIDTLMNRRAIEIGTDHDNVAGIFLQRIKRFLVRHRALGLGTMGLHHLYQSKSLPWESREAAQLNNEIFKHIRSEAEAATKSLAEMLGEPELCEGYNRRNTTLLAIAPTKSSASIMGYVSESIQPELSNYYVADLAKDTVAIKNPYLTALLESKNKNIPSVWESILEYDSVQHLDFLSDHEKAVFKTFAEIPARSLIDQAATRQQYLDQTQSFNVIYHPDTLASEIVADIYYAEAMGLPTMYYQKSISPAQLNNQRIQSDDRDCLACSS